MRIRRPYYRDKPFINVAPMVDVMFFLMLFFLISAQFYREERDIRVNLPETRTNETLSAAAQSLVTINVRYDGSYSVGGRTVSLDALRAMMVKGAQANRDQKVLVRADKQALHGYVAAAVSVCREAGVGQANIGYELPR
jgi:biopolymer transport protein ExbD